MKLKFPVIEQARQAFLGTNTEFLGFPDSPALSAIAHALHLTDREDALLAKLKPIVNQAAKNADANCAEGEYVNGTYTKTVTLRRTHSLTWTRQENIKVTFTVRFSPGFVSCEFMVSENRKGLEACVTTHLVRMPTPCTNRE